MWTPPKIAAVIWTPGEDCRRCPEAWCSATSEEEHAVSTAIEGPSYPNMNDKRPTAALGC